MLLVELIKQRDALNEQIKEAKAVEKKQAIKTIKTIAKAFDIDLSKIGKKQIAKNPLSPKYRDPVTGDTWAGRGKTPLWLKDKDRTEYELILQYNHNKG